jgi:hypothetical protein
MGAGRGRPRWHGAPTAQHRSDGTAPLGRHSTARTAQHRWGLPPPTQMTCRSPRPAASRRPRARRTPGRPCRGTTRLSRGDAAGLGGAGSADSAASRGRYGVGSRDATSGGQRSAGQPIRHWTRRYSAEPNDTTLDRATQHRAKQYDTAPDNTAPSQAIRCWAGQRSVSQAIRRCAGQHSAAPSDTTLRRTTQRQAKRCNGRPEGVIRGCCRLCRRCGRGW